MSRFFWILVLSISGATSARSQYAPAAGMAGTTAVHKDSSSIVAWASGIYDFNRGASDIANGWGVLTSFGDPLEALGAAQGNSTNVVSLGDSGSITLSFAFPIQNGSGPDFAVFENSFDDLYLEFAFVEVSSDGQRFVRFPAISLSPWGMQTGPFGYSNPELIHNLAGKYRQGYGTPFDLQDLVDSSGLNLDSIHFVRITDVIGTVDPVFATHDSEGNPINEPYPTDFAAGGFDLDGVGVIHENNIYAGIPDAQNQSVVVYPNPSDGKLQLIGSTEFFDFQLYDFSGRLIVSRTNASSGLYDFSDLTDTGIYYLVFSGGNTLKWVVVE